MTHLRDDAAIVDALNRIARLAACIFHAKAAVIRLHDGEKQGFRSFCGLNAIAGLEGCELSRQSIVAQRIDGILVVSDTRQDIRLAADPWVVGFPGVRFYVAVPLKTRAGLNVGTLAVIDTSPRRIDDAETGTLLELAQVVVDEIEMSSRLLEIHKRPEATEREEMEREGMERDDVARAANRFEMQVGADPWLRELLTSNSEMAVQLSAYRQIMAMQWDSRELWTSLVENSPDKIIVAGIDGTIRYINRVLDGLQAEDTIGRTLYDYLPPGEHEKMRQIIEKVVATGEAYLFEISGLGPEHSTAWYESRLVPVKREGEVISLILITSDITRRKQVEAERELLISREKQARVEAEVARGRISDLLESITDGFHSIDKDWCITYVNEQAARLVKKSRQELIGQKFWDAFPGVMDSAFGVEYKRCMVERVSGEVEAYYPPLDTWFVARVYPAADGISIFFQDITEHKSAEQALRESEERFRTLFEQSSVSMVITSPQNRFLQVNQAFCNLLGYSRAELLEMTVAEVTHPADWRNNCYQRDQAIAENRRVIDIEKRYLHKSGAVVWVHLLGVLILDEDRHFKYSLAVVQDMTHFKEAEAARQELLRRLVAAQEEERLRVSRELHDQLGQYLAALLLGLESLPEQAALQPEALHKVQELQEMTRHLMQQARRLALNLRPETLDRLGLADALQRYVEEWTRRTGIPVEFHSNNALDQRFSSEIEMTIYRVVQEALTNVLRHAQAGFVSLLLEYRKGQVSVIIEDNGRGFDTDAVLMSRVPDGNLGLLGMQERVSLVHGTIDIESAIGAGTTIFVRIPFPVQGKKP